MQSVDIGCRGVAESNDDIAVPDPSLLCRALRFDGDHQYAAADHQAVTTDKASMNRNSLPRDTDEASLNPSVPNEPRRDKFGRVDRDCEADSLRRQDHCRIHADHFAP